MSVPQRKGTRSSSSTMRAYAAETTSSRWPVASRLRQGRHHHRRQRQPDLRRGAARRAPPGTKCERTRAARPSARSSATARSPAPTPPSSTNLPGNPSGAPPRRARSATSTWFEINEAFAAVGRWRRWTTSGSPTTYQRQRGGHRPRPPDRHVRHTARAHPPLRARAPRRRPRRRQPSAAAAVRETPRCSARSQPAS